MDRLKVILPSANNSAAINVALGVSSRSLTPNLSARYLDTKPIPLHKPDPPILVLKRRNPIRIAERKLSEGGGTVCLQLEETHIPISYEEIKSVESMTLLARKTSLKPSITPTVKSHKQSRSPRGIEKFGRYSKSPNLRPNSVTRLANRQGPISSGPSSPICPNIVATKASPKRSYRCLSKLSVPFFREPRKRCTNFLDFSLDSFLQRRRN
mmetsp:Transcript_19126/g.34823  ORF Transcript_19126/g.34823 Transcript_19126/m.34823 type:complete len:211 (+) Transcript_19126:681-1313(+)